MDTKPAIRGEAAATDDGEHYRRMVYWYCRVDRHAEGARAEGLRYWRRLFYATRGARFAPIPEHAKGMPLYEINGGNFPQPLPAHIEALELAAMKECFLKDPWHAKNAGGDGDAYVRMLRMSRPAAVFTKDPTIYQGMFWRIPPDQRN